MWYNSSMKTALTKGFTLVELLVVIAILAVLATAVVVVLNPAELIKQARDSTRISDLAALNSALALFYSDAFPSSQASSTICTAGATVPGGGACTTNATTTVTGTGWVSGINFTLISSGSPLSKLPIDPNNGATSCLPASTACTYVWKSSTTVGVYEIDATMESAKYYSTAESQVVTDDGGNSAQLYEVGSTLAL